MVYVFRAVKLFFGCHHIMVVILGLLFINNGLFNIYILNYCNCFIRYVLLICIINIDGT